MHARRLVVDDVGQQVVNLRIEKDVEVVQHEHEGPVNARRVPAAGLRAGCRAGGRCGEFERPEHTGTNRRIDALQAGQQVGQEARPGVVLFIQRQPRYRQVERLQPVAQSVVLPNPAGAETRIRRRARPASSRACRRGRGTCSRRTGGMRSFVCSRFMDAIRPPADNSHHYRLSGEDRLPVRRPGSPPRTSPCRRGRDMGGPAKALVTMPSGAIWPRSRQRSTRGTGRGVLCRLRLPCTAPQGLLEGTLSGA